MRKHIYLLIFAGFFLLYAATAQRGVSWQDSGEFQYRILVQDYFWISGIARAHPGYIAAADCFTRLFPETHRFYALNLFSGLGMALALTLLTRLLVLLQLKRATIVLTLLTLGLSHMAWWMSTIAEVYTWSLAFLVAELLCVAKLCIKGSAGFAKATPCQGARVSACAMATADKQGSGEREYETQEGTSTMWLWICLALLNGLHAAFHNFAFLNLPVYALLFVYMQRTKRLLPTSVLVVLTAVAWLTGACLLVALFQIEWRETSSFIATLKSLLFGREFEDVVTGKRAINWPLVKMNLALSSISFFNPVWLFIFYAGRTRQTFTSFKVALLGLTLIHLLFWIRYFVPDQATFVLPTLTLLSIWVAMGLDSLNLNRKQLALLFTTILLFSVGSPIMIRHILISKQGDLKRPRQLPFREESRYWLYPWKQDERSAAQFVDEIRKTLKAGDLLIADNTAAGPVMAAQVAGQLPGKIRIITFFTGETEAELLRLVELQERAYIVSPVPGYASSALLTGQFTFEKEGVLYRIRKVRHD
jgi:hypothetical protein